MTLQFNSSKMKRISLLVFTVLIFLIMNACNPKENVDLIVVNATVYTVDENFSKTQSFTVRGGEIVATGTSDEIQKNMRQQRLSMQRENLFTRGSTMRIAISTDTAQT